jgi:hypothetical protein
MATSMQSQTGPSGPPSPYTFTFPPAPEPVPVDDDVDDEAKIPPFVPPAILSGSAVQQSTTSEASGRIEVRLDSPATEGTLSSTASLSEHAKVIQEQIKHDGTGRWYPTLYEMETAQKVHHSAEQILASARVFKAFEELNLRVNNGMPEKALVQIIQGLGAAVRSHLSPSPSQSEDNESPVLDSGYGHFVTMENVRMDDVSVTSFITLYGCTAVRRLSVTESLLSHERTLRILRSTRWTFSYEDLSQQMAKAGTTGRTPSRS